MPTVTSVARSVDERFKLCFLTGPLLLPQVELAEMIGELSFRALQHLEAVSGCVWRSVCPRMATYQEVLVQGILLDLLGDEDIRVRTAVTASLSK